MSDNPSAFPRPGFEHCAGMQDGMTLRDYFAGQALVGILTRTEPAKYADFAEVAYGIADAMLAARTGDA